MTISVVITCHNLDEFLKECVDSIKSQVRYPDEIVLVHDGCQKFMTYGGIDTLSIDKNVGVAKTRKKGAMQTTSDYLLFVDADDRLPEVFLRDMEKAVKTGSEIVYSDAVLWSSWGNIGLKSKYYSVPEKAIFKNLIKQNYIFTTSLIPRKVFFDLGGFSNYALYEDWDFYLRALISEVPFVKANAWFSYRQRMNSRNRTKDVNKQEIFEKIRADILKKIERKKHLTK